MTGEHAEDIGTLKANSKRDGKNIEGLFGSNERRKHEIKDLELSVQSIQHTVEETNQTANRVAESMEELREDLGSIKDLIVHMDGRVTALEDRKFDPVKVLRWLGTWRGTFFMSFVFLITVGVVIPDARDFIIEILDVATKAKEL